MTSTSTVLLRTVTALGIAISTPAPAPAEPRPCAQRELVVQRLAERYGETLHSMGMHQNNGLLEVYASDRTGTWTILVTTPDGMSCLLAAGNLWEGDAAPLTPPGKDA